MGLYLKEKSWYEDRYDLGTIERCLEIEEEWKKRDGDKRLNEVNETIKKSTIKIGSGLELYHVKGMRYQDRELTVRKWMEDDRRKDEFFEKAKEPLNIRCPGCLATMQNKHKDLRDNLDGALRVLFLFECPKCQKRRGVYDNGEEFKRKPEACPKCNKDLIVSFKQEGTVSVWGRHCGACGFTDQESENSAIKEAQWEAQRLKDAELLKKYRSEYCLSAPEGIEYELMVNLMKDCYESSPKTQNMESDPDYPKVVELKRIGVVELEKMLSSALEKQKYIKLSLDKPIIEKYVIVAFTIQDADSARKGRDSEYKLRKLIIKALEGTNWRLMSEGVSFRLGYLSGRLKGYDHEDDLLQAVKTDGRQKRGKYG